MAAIIIAVVFLALLLWMGSTYGRQVLDQVGYSDAVAADDRPLWKSGGVTIDWSTVAAVNADTFAGNIFIPNGEKYLRYGQILTRITKQPAQTLVDTGATAGSFTVTGTRPDNGVTATQTIAWNASVAAVQTAMDAIFGAGNTLVSGAGALPTNTLTITFQGALINYAPATLTTDSTGLTGGTAVVAVAYAGGNYNWWGPYDPAASDGRQTLTKGSTFILNETRRESDRTSMHPAVLQGGKVWKDRLLATAGTHSLAAGPTFTELEAVLTTMLYVTF